MKKKKLIVIFVACIACLANVSAQLKINSSGVITNTNAALIFKVNSTLVGFTGSSSTENSSFGYEAMLNYSAGNYNTATGSRALLSNTSGYYNTAAGCSALYFNTSGSYNTATGVCALYQNTTGIGNTASGNGALNPNTSGSYNTGIGTDALFGNTTGSHNTAVGYNAGASNPDNLTNSTVVGAGAMATGSYQARIGSSSIVSIGGFVDWTNFSDRRAKKNIRADVPGLDFISRLQPVTFNLDLDAIDGLLKIDKTKRQGEEELSPELTAINRKAREAKEKVIQTGFIAQDVEKTAKSIGYNFSGVDVDEAGIYGLRYAEFVVPLVKAVQELSEQNGRLQTQNEQMQIQNKQMQAQLDELTGLVHSLLESGAPRSGSAAEPAPGLQDDVTDNVASLLQNSPNPFRQSTVIRYTLPQTGKQAQMVISNIAGNIIRQIPLRSGTNSITIEGGTLLTDGVYYYSLYVGNSLVDTKKMILTK